MLNEWGIKDKENTTCEVPFKGATNSAHVDEWLKTNLQSMHDERSKAFFSNRSEEGQAFYTKDALCVFGQKTFSGEEVK